MGLVGSPSTGGDWQCPQRGTWEVKPCGLTGSVVLVPLPGQKLEPGREAVEMAN